MPVPAVRVRQCSDQLSRGFAAEIDVLVQPLLLPAQPVDASCARIDLALVVLPVSDELLVEVAEVNRAIGCIRKEYRTECRVLVGHRLGRVTRLESRTARVALSHDDIPRQRISSPESSRKAL